VNEPWSLSLREEYALQLSLNKMLREIFEPKKDEVSEQFS